MNTFALNEDIRRIIAELQDPAAYPHPVENVHLVQTHVSCVFLTGDYVYKVKKPVNFGFLDYSTLEKRHAFCEQEVLLNRRLCPDIYLDVVPLTRTGGRLHIGGLGEPVDWAVRMRQMREEEMLSRRLAAGTVGEEEIERLARILAAFHARAGTDSYVRQFARPDVIFNTVRNTLRVMDEVAGEVLQDEKRAALRNYLTTFWCRKQDFFQQRMAEGRTRDCHGDLRTQNICLDARFDGGIQIFDCIEFNDAFRYIDVAADIAYLAMDLDLAGRADLREHLMDVYQQASGDESLPRILPYYQTYRAIVRGNIALLAAAESELGEAERQMQRETAATDYDLARSYAGRRQHPALLITVGFSGSGKSVLARELCRRLPAVRLSSDQVRKELAGVPVAASLESTHYGAAQRAAIYEELRRRAEHFLARKEHVLLDATFLDKKERDAAANLAWACGAEFWILDCQCRDAVIRQRLQARSHDPNASDADIRVYEAQQRTYTPVGPPALRAPCSFHYITVSTDRPVNETAHTFVDRFLSPVRV